MKKVIISLILVLSIVSSAYAEDPLLWKSLKEISQKSQTQSNIANATKANYTYSASYKQSPQLKQAIRQYKSGNYIGAMQSLEDITYNDPGNALAHYYLGMTYVQVGDKNNASTEYDKVISLSPKSPLADNATIGKNNLSDNPTAYKTGNTSTFSMPDPSKLKMPVVQSQKDFLSDETKEKIREKNIKNIIDNVNNSRKTNPAVYKRLDNFDPSNKKSSLDKPTQEQITEAMQVLTKAGINPYTASATNTQQINPELMQMNMMMGALGGNGNNNNMMGGNSSNNMLPLLMMMQNGQGNNKVDPATIQAMMSSMMMPGMMNMYENNNNNNN